MSERGNRYSRVSPTPAKGATAAYTLCPLNDPDAMTNSNVLSIPLSSISLPSTNKSQVCDNIGMCYIFLISNDLVPLSSRFRSNHYLCCLISVKECFLCCTVGPLNRVNDNKFT